MKPRRGRFSFISGKQRAITNFVIDHMVHQWCNIRDRPDLSHFRKWPFMYEFLYSCPVPYNPCAGWGKKISYTSIHSNLLTFIVVQHNEIFAMQFVNDEINVLISYSMSAHSHRCCIPSRICLNFI